MKRLATLLVLAALTALMLHPVTPQVNNSFGKADLRAEGGMPMPPFPGGVLVAEGGMPMPPFPGGGVAA